MENKQISVSNSGGTLGQYVYDGDGKRVKKTSAAEETIFVYDAAGKEIAEYSTALNPTPQVSYLTADNLGTPRINTDQTGAVISRHDYQPYGEEIAVLASPPATPERNAGVGYQDDAVRKQFTGYERDDESELDFAQARYYNSKHGRFTSPDDFFNDTELGDPQSFNKYVYVRNNPLSLIDPTGKKADVNVTYDEKTKTYNITVTAKFGVYVESGKLTQKQINKQVSLLKSQIKDIYKTTASFDGVKANVSVNVTVTQYSSESAAVSDANEGKIDNVVGLVKGSFIGGGEPGERPSPGAIGRGYRVEGESFDRMLVATDSTASNGTYAHEFGHLLNARGHQDETPGLMNTFSRGNNYLGFNDFKHIFKKYVDNNNQSALYIYSENNSERLWVGTVRAATIYKKKSTISPR